MLHFHPTVPGELVSRFVWRCEAVAAASSRQIRSRARSRWTAGVRPLPRPPETSSQSDPAGRLRFTHDCYLKLWQLSDPHLPADYVLLDEAQDANPVVAAIVDRQAHAQRILVGDRCQAIYGWRGAIDAMSRFHADHRLCLSQSFRFGPAIASEANKWLQLLDAPLHLRGF